MGSGTVQPQQQPPLVVSRGKLVPYSDFEDGELIAHLEINLVNLLVSTRQVGYEFSKILKLERYYSWWIKCLRKCHPCKQINGINHFRLHFHSSTYFSFYLQV